MGVLIDTYASAQKLLQEPKTVPILSKQAKVLWQNAEKLRQHWFHVVLPVRFSLARDSLIDDQSANNALFVGGRGGIG